MVNPSGLRVWHKHICQPKKNKLKEIAILETITETIIKSAVAHTDLYGDFMTLFTWETAVLSSLPI